MPLFYAEKPGMRTRQLLRDTLVLAWVVLWVVLGMQLHDVVTLLAAPGEGLAAVGTSLRSGADRVADAVEGTPLVGGGLAAPFAALGSAAGDLVGVGEATREAAHRLALWLSLLVSGVAVLPVVVAHALQRGAWVRRASAAARLRDEPGTLRVLALRAVVNRPLEELRRVSSDPLLDLEERPELLAALELRDLGLRPGP